MFVFFFFNKIQNYKKKYTQKKKHENKTRRYGVNMGLSILEGVLRHNQPRKEKNIKPKQKTRNDATHQLHCFQHENDL